jgi:oligoendopeptidase F
MPYSDVNPLDWTTIQPHVDALLSHDLTAETVTPFLQQWSDLWAILYEARARIDRAVAENTADEQAEQRFLTFIEQIVPQAEVAEQALKAKLLAVPGYTPTAETANLMQRFQAEAEIFREANIPLYSDLMRLSHEYDKLVGAMTITWQGQEETIPQAELHLRDPDRATREQAWHAIMARYAAERQPMNDLYLKMLALRRQIARNAGFANFRDYQWRAFGRFDYTPADCATFRDAIEHEVVPLASRLYAERRQHLGLAPLRPWDTEVDLYGEPLTPFQDAAELEEVGHRIFQQLDPALATHFAIMRDGYLDLASRPNKAPGGFCQSFPVSRKPYIFMNAVGTHNDVSTLLHEGGHAFHYMESLAQPYIWNSSGPTEFCEVASIAMQLLGAPYLEKRKGGFYDEAEARRAYAEELRSIVLFLPYMAIVDAFQHWVYTEAPETVTAADLDRKWAELWDRFRPGTDWQGLDAAKETGWHRKVHIFTIPFYYVEYGLAYLGALQVWRNALRDQSQALTAYRAALALGHTRSLPELFQAAGATFAFDRKTIGELMALIGQQLTILEA